MTSQTLPEAVWSGTFTVLGVVVHCHTLCDGRRIIEADSMARLFAAMDAAPEMIDLDDAAEAFLRWRGGGDVH